MKFIFVGVCVCENFTFSWGKVNWDWGMLEGCGLIMLEIAEIRVYL